MKKFFLFLVMSFFLSGNLESDQIIQDKKGNYFILKNDGSYKRLPKPKPGHKYIIKERKVPMAKERWGILKKTEKKARTRTNTGFR